EPRRLAEPGRPGPGDGEVASLDDETVVAPGQRPPLECHREEELGEGEREEGEVRPAEAHAEGADPEPGGGAAERGEAQGPKERQARQVVQREPERVATDAKRGGVTEGEEARVAEQQVERDGEEPEVENLDHDPEPEGVDEPRQRVEDRHRHERHRQSRPPHPFSPKSPWGRRISTAAISRNSNTIANSGNQRIPKDWSSPIMSEARSAPSREPKPPMTITTKRS